MDNEQYLKDLADAEKRNQQIQLDQQRAASLTSLEQEKAKVMPTFTQAKKETSVASQIGAKNFAEFLANRGQTSSGLAAQSEMSRQNVLARDIGNIGKQEQQALTDYSNQATGIQRDYSNQLANAYNTVDTNYQTNLYNEKIRQQEAAAAQKKYDQEFAYKKAQDELAQKNYAAEVAYKKAQDRAARNLSWYNAKKPADNTGKVNKYSNMPMDYQSVSSVASGDNMIYTVTNADGSKSQYTFEKGTNPFTGTVNPDAKSSSGTLYTFSNGYQPNNINGTKLSKYDDKAVQLSGGKQSVWTYGKNKYAVWDGTVNAYRPARLTKTGDWQVDISKKL